MPYRAKGTKEEESQRLNHLASEAAKSNGGSVKPSFAESNMTQLAFKCSKGHTFPKTIRAVVSRGGWCDYCRQDIPYNQKEAREMLAESAWTLLSNYSAVTELVKVKCHICKVEREGPYFKYFNKPCHHVKRSPELANLRLEAKVSELGGTVITKGVRRLASIHKFKCLNGHVFELSGQSVVQRSSWCRECGENWVTRSKVEKLIRERGGTPVAPIPETVNSKTKITIRCSLGHEFDNDWNHMAGSSARWCSVCSKGSKSEEIARTTFRQLFGAEFKKRRPAWLVNDRGRQMELDGYEPELGIAFEYQGRQHFENVGIYRMGSRLSERIQDDQRKRKLCKKHGVKLIELRWDQKYEEFPKIIRMQLGRLADSFDVDWDRKIDVQQAFIRDDRIEELRGALATRNLELISKKWIDVSYRYLISCKVCGHKFTQSARSYLNSKRVAGCKKCAMKVTAKLSNQRKLGRGYLVQIASDYKATLVSKVYVDARTAYVWKCHKGHRIRRTLGSIKRSGRLCLECGRS